MAALAPSAVRQRIATALDALTNWSETAMVPERFGVAPNSVAHLRFAVFGGEIKPHARDRQLSSEGVQVSQPYTIRFGWKLKPKAQIASYDAADAECQAAILAVEALSRTDLHLWLTRRLAPVVSPDGERLTLGFVVATSYRMALA